jgi:hypothetical protein
MIECLRCRGNNLSRELFPSNDCCTVAVYNSQLGQKMSLSRLRVLCCRGKSVSTELFPSNGCCTVAVYTALGSGSRFHMSSYELDKDGSVPWYSPFKRQLFTMAFVTQFYPGTCISFSVLLFWIWHRGNNVETKTWWTGDLLGDCSLAREMFRQSSQQRACRRAAVPGEYTEKKLFLLTCRVTSRGQLILITFALLIWY